MPAVGGEKAAQHADGGGLAAAIGAEKTADFAFGDLEAQAVDDFQGAEALSEVVDVDDIGHHGPFRAIGGGASGRTAIGWPGLINVACSRGGRASTM